MPATRALVGQIGSTLGFAVSAVIKRHPLVAFFVLAFALTWAPTPFGIFMGHSRAERLGPGGEPNA